MGFAGHYNWDEIGGGGSGREDPAAVCEHRGLYKSESRAGVGELGERRPRWPSPCLKAPDLLLQPTVQTSITDQRSQCSNELTRTDPISIKAPII